MVLDDDTAMQRLVTLLLEREGYRVDVVSQGRQAIDSLERTQYDAIVLDLMMPHEGGVTVIRHLRERNPDLLRRVLLLTAAPERLLHPYAEEVAAVIRKPFEAAVLSSAVQRAAAA